MRGAWIALSLVACYRGSTPSPGGTGVGSGSGSATAVTTATTGEPVSAPLEGRLQIQPADLCGGARPPDDHQSPPLAPAPGIPLHVFAGDTYTSGAPLTTITTGTDGVFRADVPAGRYCVARDHGAKPVGPVDQHTDLACLVARWERCEAVVEVPVKTRVAVDIYEPCQWSICYHGPPPP